ncbi:MAG: NAD(P)H-dependent oxidoreductase [Nocardioides sp.]|nr:NAD(P)H-dependent oxidoreductase [Nocardioidaceae bacterium]MCB8958134.1 NAD(P)H-dependent oxidoreductase [Nocardioides sp.]
MTDTTSETTPDTTPDTTLIAVLVGSLRSDSVNRKLAELLAEQSPEGVTVEIVDGLGQIPFYNEDIDNPRDIPAAAAELRDRVGRSDRVLAVTPEYNGTMPAVLNNAIDWLSRPYGAGALVGKPFGVVGATPTPYGGKWAHEDAARSARIAGATVVEDVTVSQSAVEVDVLTDPEVLDRLTRAVRTLVDYDVATVAA